MWIQKDVDPPGFEVKNFPGKEIPDISGGDTLSIVQSQKRSTGSDDEIPDAIIDESISTVHSQAGSSTVPSQAGSSNVQSQAVSSTVPSQERSTGQTAVRKKRKRTVPVYQFLDSGDEDQPYVSGSDSEVERRIKKKQKSGNEKRMWTREEKELLTVLVPNSVRSGKQPVKEHVLKLKRGSALDHLPWLKIKHQVWAMAKAEMKKKIIKELI